MNGATGAAAGLAAGVRAGHTRVLGRALSIIERGGPGASDLLAALGAGGPAPAVGDQSAGGELIIGITGAPGSGKSSIVAALVTAYRERGNRVAVLAVDPSSPFTGGAVLGDRVRMQQHATDPGVFIRSMAARGHLGGLSAATGQAMRVLSAAGFDVILVETVGVGQSEVEVATTCDCVVVVLAPGMGDSVQAAKAGVLEVGDVYVVNKADRDGAQVTARELRQMVALGDEARDGREESRAGTQWRPRVVLTTANRSGGVGELIDALDAYHAWLTDSGQRPERRLRRARAEIIRLLLERVRGAAQAVGIRQPADALDDLAEEVSSGRLDAVTAAHRLLELILDEQSAVLGDQDR